MAKALTYNPFEDDLTMRNYLALYACIVNPKLSYNRALNIFEIPSSYKNTREKNSDLGYKVKVIDTWTNESIICEDVNEVRELLGLNQKDIYAYIEIGYLHKQRYSLEKIE